MGISITVHQLNCLIWINSLLNTVKKERERESSTLQDEGGNAFQRVKVK